MQFESAEDFAGSLLAAELHGFGNDYVSEYPVRISSVSADAARQAAQRVLDPDNAVIVIVGDGSSIEPQLRKAGWKYERIGHMEPISNWERKALEAPPEVSSDPVKLAGARKILDEAIKAKGGAKRLQGIKSFSWRGRAELRLPGGTAPATVHKRYIAPDKLRLDMEISGGANVKIITVLASKSGWAREISPRGDQKTTFKDSELQALRTQLWRDQDLVLTRYLDKGAVVEPLPERIVNGKKQYVVRVTDASGLRKVVLLVDAKTKMLTGMEYSDLGMNTSERYSDYKDVDGIKMAHTRHTKGPQVDFEVKVLSASFNKKVAPLLFLEPSEKLRERTDPGRKKGPKAPKAPVRKPKQTP
jgi:hypothetical protein